MILLTIKYFYCINFNKLSLLTYRSIMSLLTSLVLSIIVGPHIINYLKKHKIHQTIRKNGPKRHYQKKNTPTMGGLIILLSIITSILLWSDLSNIYIWYTLMILVGFGIIGMIDDCKKICLRTSQGLSSIWKFFFVFNIFFFNYLNVL